MLRLETTKSFMHIVFQVQINCFFRNLFGRFTIVCFFYKIAEGPDSFCHHCIITHTCNLDLTNTSLTKLSNTLAVRCTQHTVMLSRGFYELYLLTFNYDNEIYCW